MVQSQLVDYKLEGTGKISIQVRENAVGRAVDDSFVVFLDGVDRMNTFRRLELHRRFIEEHQ